AEIRLGTAGAGRKRSNRLRGGVRLSRRAMADMAPFRRENGAIGREFKQPNQRSSVDIPYSTRGTRNYDSGGSGRKPGRDRVQRLAQPLALERLDQQAVHAGGEAGVAIFALRIGGERQHADRPVAGLRLGGSDAAGGLPPRPSPQLPRPHPQSPRAV